MTETKRAAVRRAACGWTLTLAGLAAAPLANADTTVLETTSYITGTQSTVYSMNIAGSGTLSISLSNLNWPERLSSLSFALVTSSGVLAKLEEGSSTLTLTSGGTYYALVAGTAQGLWNAGMYSLRIGYSDAAPVPLPAGVWLLSSGLVGLLGLRAAKKSSRKLASMTNVF